MRYTLVRGPTLVRSKSLVTTSSHFSAVRSLFSAVPAQCIAEPSRLHITTYSRSSVQYRRAAHIDEATVLSWQYTHHTSRTTRAIDAMRGREQCLILDRTPKPPDGHKCRGECGVCLHGIHFVVKWKILTVIIHSTASVRHALRPRQLPTPYICSVL